MDYITLKMNRISERFTNLFNKCINISRVKGVKPKGQVDRDLIEVVLFRREANQKVKGNSLGPKSTLSPGL
jgi:hypothetical protein